MKVAEGQTEVKKGEQNLLESRKTLSKRIADEGL